jgi:glyceraldehyde 3-phosphate dehydrogenase
MRIGINGFGRIGRCVTRHILESRPDMQIVKINATGDVETNTHLYKYDSVHGRSSVDIPDNVEWSHVRDITACNWPSVDIVLECTGAYNDGNTAGIHKLNGARKVLISAPASNVSRTVVYGVNHNTITADDDVVSNASCTTNCLAPLADVLHTTVGIESGIVTTVHAYTGDQFTLDRRHKDLYRARAAGTSMIPTIRVPTPNVSCVDMTFQSAQTTTVEEINLAVLEASKTEMAGILGYEPAPLVSVDFNHTSESSIFAPDQTRVVGGKLVRVLAWYDNEWAFSVRMADVAEAMAKY